MTFSNARISQLHRDRADREETFRRSRESLERSVRDWTNPLHFVRDNPGAIKGSGKILLWLMGFGKNGTEENGNGRKASGFQGWALKIASVAALFAGRSLRPGGATALRFVINGLIQRFKRR